MDLGGFQSLLEAHGRKDGGKPPGQHGLSGPWWPDHQDVVGARRGDLEGALGRCLGSHIGEVDLLSLPLRHQRADIGARGDELPFAREMCADLAQRARATDLESFDHRGLRQILVGDQNATAPGGSGGERHRERAPDRAQVALQSHFADDEVFVEAVMRELIARDEQAHSDRQVETGAALSNVGWGQIDRDPFEGERIARVGKGRTDALAPLPHRPVREPDGREGWQSTADVDLDIDGIGIDAEHGGRADAGKQQGSWARVGAT